MTSRLKELEAFGQAVWLDFVERKFVAEGGLHKLVEEDGLTGVTSNPSIFEKAIGHGDAYRDDLEAFGRASPDASAIERFEHLAIKDIRDACDALRPVHDRLQGKDGYVSLEVSPLVAHDSGRTAGEAERLWQAVDRPNLMVKIPGTPEGVGAIRATIEAGINVNVTLLFSVDAYKAVAEAHLAGLEARLGRGEPIANVAGVASFFVSRIDSQIDKAIDARVKAGDAEREALTALKGKVAIANAKIAYQHYLELVGGERWRLLAAKGARPQRLLWASTGTKNPDYSDVLYVEKLIGPDTVNTMPPKTMDAFRDHGTASETLTTDLDGARHVLAEVERLGLDLNKVTTDLVADGVKQFEDAFADLLKAVEAKHEAVS